jgi:hypothetical protein
VWCQPGKVACGGGLGLCVEREASSTLSEPLAASLLQPFDDLAKLWIVTALVIVPKALLRVAPCARNREVFEVVGSPVVLRQNVLERRPVQRCPISLQRQLSLAVNALSLEDWLPTELLPLEGSIARRHTEEQLPLSARSHTASIANMARKHMSKPRRHRLFPSCRSE